MREGRLKGRGNAAVSWSNSTHGDGCGQLARCAQFSSRAPPILGGASVNKNPGDINCKIITRVGYACVHIGTGVYTTDDVYFVFPEGPGKEIACYGIASIRNISRSGQADLPPLTAPCWVWGV